MLTLAAGVWSIKGQRNFFCSGIGLILGILVVTLVGYVLDHSGTSILHILLMLVFFSLTCWVAIRQVLFSGRVDGNSIVGAICIYLLLGMIWAMLYLLIERTARGYFKGLPETADSTPSSHALTVMFPVDTPPQRDGSCCELGCQVR